MLENFEKFYNYGFQVIDKFYSPEEIILCKNKLEKIYNLQKNEIGEQKLKIIKEENIVRAPFLYDNYFLDFIKNEKIIKIVKKILGEHAILNLQNSIIISPNQKHHQSFYHRDIIYQDFITSKPIGINLYLCLDDYNLDNGGTCFIPKSHKMDSMPESYEEITPEVSAGSIILFDSMIYHKAGINKTNSYRYGINNMFTLPFIKQQINIPYAFNQKYSDEYPLNRLLGYHSREYYSVLDFREERYKRAVK